MLNLKKRTCRMEKIANNLEKHGTDDKVKAFDIPFSLEITAEELDDLLGKYTSRGWFDTKGKITYPMEWLSNVDLPIKVNRDIECESITIRVSGDVEFEFSNDDDDADGEEAKPIRLTKLAVGPSGGQARLTFQVRVRPRTDRECVQLLNHQRRDVKLTTVDPQFKRKNDAQAQLPLDGEKPGEEGEVSSGFKPTKTAEQIDAEMHARADAQGYPRTPMGEAAVQAPPDDDQEAAGRSRKGKRERTGAH